MTSHTIEIINPCEKRISVTVDAKTVRKEIQKKVRTKANQIKYGGFRPTAAITQQRIIKNLLPEEKVEIQRGLYSHSLSSICSKENIQYVGMPIIQDVQFNPDESLSYISLLEVYPEISHVRWENASLEKIETVISEEAISQASPLFEEMGLNEIMTSQEMATHWCEWIIEVFQYQKLREQIMKILPEQNTVSALPERVIEARYQELQKERTEQKETDNTLKETARQYIIADILFKAYALEHNITVTQEMLVTRVQKASQNPFIMSYVKEHSQLPYYLAPRIFEEAVINHLVSQAHCSITTLPLSKFIALAFNRTAPNIAEEEK